MNRTNPYNYNLPVEPEMFFGRHADVVAMVNDLTGVPGDSVALIGGRRMGKTSMLEAVRRAIEARSEEDGGQLLFSIFMDLSGEGIDSVAAFFQSVYEQAQAGLSISLGMPDSDIRGLGQPPAPAFRRMLEAWGRAALAQRGRQLRIVLLLDECEEIVEQPWATDLHAALRALLVGQSTRSLLKVVMAGSHRFLTQVRQRGSPLWNVLTYYKLRVLGEQPTHDLITLPARNSFADDVVRAIVEQSGGQPFLTQYLAHHLWDRGAEQAGADSVRQLAATFHHDRNDFADWSSGLGAAGLQVYGILSTRAESLVEQDLQAQLDTPLPNLAQALDALCYHGVIATDGNRYWTTGLMFRHWFATFSPRLEDKKQPDERADVIQIKQRRLQILEQQAAIQGISTPPQVVLEIEDLQREIAALVRNSTH